MCFVAAVAYDGEWQHRHSPPSVIPAVQMEISDWVMIGATLLGPILAVQAQKYVERVRERKTRKQWVFHALMSTRLSRLASEHVQALNVIDLVFYGTRVMGIHRRTKSEQTVLDAWKEYFDQLSTPFDEASTEIWGARREELFVNLLYAIAIDVGYRFDRVQLKRSAYSPQGHGELEEELTGIRKAALKILSGEAPLPMALRITKDAEAAQQELQRKLTAALDGSGALTVQVKEKGHGNSGTGES